MSAYYNEHDKFAAEWLRQLIKAGLIADGEVDERDIRDVRPEELTGFTQCHFFAGIGVWSYALRRAGFRDDQKVWTGSCPCQPFSAAGKRAGFDDERHLWPAFFHLIRVCRPSVCFGEQVSSSDGETWLDLVQADLEGEDYRFAPLDLCSAGFGSPNIRQRLYWVADSMRAGTGRNDGDGASAQSKSRGTGHSNGNERSDTALPCGAVGGLADLPSDGWNEGRPESAGIKRRPDATECRSNGRVEHTADHGLSLRDGAAGDRQDSWQAKQRPCPTSGLADSASDRQSGSGATRQAEEGLQPRPECEGELSSGLEGRGFANGFWNPAEWVLCDDPDGPKWRPVEPGTFPLVTGATNRVGRLRGYGNALNAEVAKAFIEAYREVTEFPSQPCSEDVARGVDGAQGT